MGFPTPAQGKAMAGASITTSAYGGGTVFGDSPGKVPTCFLPAHPAGLGESCPSGRRSQFQCLLAQLTQILSTGLYCVGSGLAESGGRGTTHSHSSSQGPRAPRAYSSSPTAPPTISWDRKAVRIRTRGRGTVQSLNYPPGTQEYEARILRLNFTGSTQD